MLAGARPTHRSTRRGVWQLVLAIALIPLVLFAVRGPLMWGLLLCATLLVAAAGWQVWLQRWPAPAGRRWQFTREGRYFIALTFGVGFAAINTGNNLLFLILGMLLSFVIVSGVLSEASLHSLTALRQLPGQAFAGRPFLTGITLANGKRRLPSFSIEVEDVIEDRPLAKKCYFLKIPASARQHTSYRCELRYRGQYRYRGFLVSTRFPFALFRKSRYIDSPAEFLVMPRIYPVDRLPDSIRSQVGDLTQPRAGTARDFFGLRGYRHGDSARDIHWKRSAKVSRLIVREYASDAGRHAAVILNNRLPPSESGAVEGPPKGWVRRWLGKAIPPPAPDEALTDQLEYCVDLAASLAVHLSRRGFSVEVVTADGRVRIKNDGAGLNAALRMLALVAFEPALEPVALRASGGSVGGFVITHQRGRHLVRANLAFSEGQIFEIADSPRTDD